MTIRVNNQKSKFNLGIASKIEAYLKSIAGGFDRKSYNPPDDIVVYVRNVPHEWIDIGFVPRPTTRLGLFTLHMIHGLAMRYPFHRVLAFSLINTRPKKKSERPSYQQEQQESEASQLSNSTQQATPSTDV
ncbi:MAG: hypothetical protein AAF639_20455 [Chloroflexota bacterium]